jgi:hypothetical protein
MERANRISVQATDNGYKATFYRTHKVVAEILSQDTEWVPAEDANKTQAREAYRTYCTEHASLWDVEWDAGKAQQAWDRKYQSYATDEQISEDAITLLTPMVDRLVDKCKYRISLAEIQMLSVDAVDTNLSYIEDGRYASNGNWAWADIAMQIVLEEGVEIEYHMALKSGQICKPKLTIAEFEQILAQEAELADVELVDLKAQAKAEKESKKKAS